MMVFHPTLPCVWVGSLFIHFVVLVFLVVEVNLQIYRERKAKNGSHFVNEIGGGNADMKYLNYNSYITVIDSLQRYPLEPSFNKVK